MFIINYILNHMDWFAIGFIAIVLTFALGWQLELFGFNGRTYQDFGVLGSFIEMFRFLFLCLIAFVFFFVITTLIAMVLMFLWLWIF